MTIEIDRHSGFCPGVTNAIKMAELELEQNGVLYCLGDIVHNTIEVERLKKKGLIIIDYNRFQNLKDATVLIRAHGEPPETYNTAKKNNILLIDASCKVVLNLQRKIRQAEANGEKGIQIVIYGKKQHAEVNGLVGQTHSKAIVVSEMQDLNLIDFSKPVFFFSQTTQSPEKYRDIIVEAKNRATRILGHHRNIEFLNSICPLVAKREPLIQKFATEHSIVLFVSDPKSSNGKMLYNLCSETNPRSYFVSGPEDIKPEWFKADDHVGICGATSTPLWLMEEVASCITNLAENIQ
ncbi:MAG: 4-hydroxy-3-methylbut-2-enyl diphosphate reductase [Bacteroidales bacterium]|nr:4-hydroxy-3-methylbut-2-enyl diphosphate reductase [Bacteroidales bacterium]HOY37976.1 4-hydroxy-3-methylbut-2-enyl diphosphate reductase [Bacteroidales bacterium]HQP03167.1 4-hydroxy-3-methylbut-2-enyl diphosphate reductase [Bacteroidales bacterium]